MKLFIENNVELVMHGHSHEMRDYERKGIRFLNAGGAVDNSKAESASIIMIDIDSDRKIEVNVHSLDLGRRIPVETVYAESCVPSLAG